ncbi:class I SAM-dependent methyltransferase [Paenibacillus mendelii]|uniref:Class I SAM-dependent methyltransferase n=1 Tax=Paenibacillus mendelii TaxID=206163 RepID=A0ABV6JDD5_9BACL|nr:class I SAM-dependent methyltransferase [Paenibacillus mendelii]MCQ6563638.1 class I SAM-dependent methyltransferase [Paenibacillus mendelii]
MADHYYSKSPVVKSDRQIHETVLRNYKLRFATDKGVFSKSGIDYGSRVLVEALELAPGASVLDVGCGYGAIGITAAKLNPAGHITMIDINERAVQLAQDNAVLNEVSNVTVLQSDLYEQVKDRTYDVIVTNPPIRAGKSVVHRIFEEGAGLLRPGGCMWVVIQKKQGAPSAEAKLNTLFDRVDEMTKDKGYRIFRSVKDA